jgi:hypothetical protein
MITKNNSIIKFLAACTLVLGFAFNTTAQTTDNDQILAETIVLTGIDVTAISNLNFGFVSPGITKAVGLDGVAVPASSNQTGVTVGRFEVEAGEGASVDLTYGTLPDELTHTNTIDKLQVNEGAYISVFNTTATPVGGTTLNTGGGTTNIASFPAGGIIYVYLGGEVNPGNTQLAGYYSAPVVLTATYN